MAVILGRKKGKSIELSGNNGQIIYRLPLVYLVYDETGTQSEGTIISTVGLPLVNEPFTIDGVQFTIACKSKRAEQWDNNNKYWTVTCDCDNEPFESGNGGGDKEGDQPDPTTWIPIVKLEYETIDWVVDTDWDGNTILNFANRPYSSPLTIKRLIPCLKFTQYENPNARLIDIISFNENLNLNTYLGMARGMWMLTIEDCDKGYKNGYLCWKIDYKLRLNRRKLNYKADTYYMRTFTGGIVDVNDYIPELIDSGNYMSGWLPIVPQLDYLAKDGTPVKDKDKNQIFGKLNPDGTQVDPADQDNYEKMNYLIHEPYDYADFSKRLRLNQEE